VPLSEDDTCTVLNQNDLQFFLHYLKAGSKLVVVWYTVEVTLVNQFVSNGDQFPHLLLERV
jgi:hypothetical protein